MMLIKNVSAASILIFSIIVGLLCTSPATFIALGYDQILVENRSTSHLCIASESHTMMVAPGATRAFAIKGGDELSYVMNHCDETFIDEYYFTGLSDLYYITAYSDRSLVEMESLQWFFWFRVLYSKYIIE